MMEMLRRGLTRVADIWGVIERLTTGLLVSTMVLLYGFNVIIRVFLPSYASTFAWIDEATRYMLVWAVFLGAGITLEIGRHISVDVLLMEFPKRLLVAVYNLIDIVGIVFCIGASYFSLKLTLFVASTGQISPTLGISAAVLYVAPCVGFASLAFRFLLRLTNVRDSRRSAPRPGWAGSETA